MPATLAVINCSQLVTLRSPTTGPRTRDRMRELSIIENGAMLVDGEKILDVGSRREIEPRIDTGCEVIDARGRVVMPGFVDAHTHPVFAGTRVDEYEQRATGATYSEIAARGGGIRSTVRHTRAASLEQLIEVGRHYSTWFLRSGTTTVEAKSGYGLTLEDEIKILRAIKNLNEVSPLQYVPTFLGAHDVPDEYLGRRGEYVDLVCNEMIPAVTSDNLAEYCDVFCEKGVFSIGESRRILSKARSMGLGLRIHADQLSLSGGTLLAAELKTATADHLEYANENGFEALRVAGVQPILLPGSVYALGSTRYPLARQMIDRGLPVVLATDFNPGSSPTTSMPAILSLASTHMKMTPAEAVTAATINAAYSVGRGATIGSLEAGKQADFVIHDAADYREIACFFGIEHAEEVVIKGRKVFSRK